MRNRTLAALTLIATMALAASLFVMAQDYTSDEILDLVENKSIVGGDSGSAVIDFSFAVHFNDTNEDLEYVLKAWSIRNVEGEDDKGLILYQSPDLVAGTLMLATTPDVGDGQIWLYLPYLGQVKELISDSAKGQDFIDGSGISKREISEGWHYREDYASRIAAEEEMQGMPTYVLDLTLREGHEKEWNTITLWVHRTEFAVVRAEFYDANGTLGKVVEGEDFYTDAVGFISHTVYLHNLRDDTESVVTLANREDAAIPAEYFDPASLPTLVLE